MAASNELKNVLSTMTGSGYYTIRDCRTYAYVSSDTLRLILIFGYPRDMRWDIRFLGVNLQPSEQPLEHHNLTVSLT